LPTLTQDNGDSLHLPDEPFDIADVRVILRTNPDYRTEPKRTKKTIPGNAMETKKMAADWRAIESKLATTERELLIVLLKGLYALGESNQVFLTEWLGGSHETLRPYKLKITQWICPDISQKSAYSIQKAKQAIGDYKKSPGSHAEGVAELLTFYCEESIGFLKKVGVDDEAYNASLTLMFEQALKAVVALPSKPRAQLLERLESVCQSGKQLGEGVSDDFGWLWEEAGRGLN
jgi:hypothetical protein